MLRFSTRQGKPQLVDDQKQGNYKGLKVISELPADRAIVPATRASLPTAIVAEQFLWFLGKHRGKRGNVAMVFLNLPVS